MFTKIILVQTLLALASAMLLAVVFMPVQAAAVPAPAPAPVPVPAPDLSNRVADLDAADMVAEEEVLLYPHQSWNDTFARFSK